MSLLSECLESARKIHDYLLDNCWDGDALIGPDSGIRINYRFGRFVKSYLRWVPWNDRYYYLQAQAYWILSNWRLMQCTAQECCRDIALRCSNFMLLQQREDGAWLYPNREWKGRVAAAEGTWGSLGLLETYRQTRKEEFLQGALRWHRFLYETLGFQQSINDEWAVNYFANRGSARIPNNSAFVLRFFAELADLTCDGSYLSSSRQLLNFLRGAQRDNGEFPYALRGEPTGSDRTHFQCYQYNAFQCLDLIRYQELTGDVEVLPLIKNGLRFLQSGFADDGHVVYDCANHHREVTYHTVAVAAALAQGLGGLGQCEQARRAYKYLIKRQRGDGSFPHSRGDYFILQDQRSYPRNLSMILYHLLLPQRMDG